MTCWALVPLKMPGEGKTRLSSVLSPSLRKSLVISMLEHVINALTESDSIDRIAIVGATSTSFPADILHLKDPGEGLNPALASASNELRMRGAEELLVIHADLPFVTSREIDEFVRSGRSQGVGLASDRHGKGTNAVYLRAFDEFSFNFGVDSLRRHQAVAEARSLKPALCVCRGLLFDIDTEEDLTLLGNQPLPFKNIELSRQRTLSHG